MSKLSGIRDVDREILSKIDDKDLIKVCSIDKYTWNIVCDDPFIKRRMLSKYPEIKKYKKEEESWKQFFLRSLYYISLLKEKFDYEYEYGNFQTQLILKIPIISFLVFQSKIERQGISNYIIFIKIEFSYSFFSPKSITRFLFFLKSYCIKPKYQDNSIPMLIKPKHLSINFLFYYFVIF